MPLTFKRGIYLDVKILFYLDVKTFLHLGVKKTFYLDIKIFFQKSFVQKMCRLRIFKNQVCHKKACELFSNSQVCSAVASAICAKGVPAANFQKSGARRESVGALFKQSGVRPETVQPLKIFKSQQCQEKACGESVRHF